MTTMLPGLGIGPIEFPNLIIVATIILGIANLSSSMQNSRK